MQRKALGLHGEKLAADYLIKQNYSIVVRNFHSRFGEIDIVATQKNTYVFIEVKTRKSFAFGEPEEGINRKKLKKIYQTIFHFFQKNQLETKNIDWRIDLIAIKLTQSLQIKEINHYQNIALYE